MNKIIIAFGLVLFVIGIGIGFQTQAFAVVNSIPPDQVIIYIGNNTDCSTTNVCGLLIGQTYQINVAVYNSGESSLGTVAASFIDYNGGTIQMQPAGANPSRQICAYLSGVVCEQFVASWTAPACTGSDCNPPGIAFFWSDSQGSQDGRILYPVYPGSNINGNCILDGQALSPSATITLVGLGPFEFKCTATSGMVSQAQIFVWKSGQTEPLVPTLVLNNQSSNPNVFGPADYTFPSYGSYVATGELVSSIPGISSFQAFSFGINLNSSCSSKSGCLSGPAIVSISSQHPTLIRVASFGLIAAGVVVAGAGFFVKSNRKRGL